MAKITIIGAGLAGSEAAWQAAEAGCMVELHEMRPVKTTKAHTTGLCAELVCSNSFRGAALTNAVGLLKEELKIWGSLIMRTALAAEVPAGGALAVDRQQFSALVDQRIRTHPRIQFVSNEITSIPQSSRESPVIIATGPLSSPTITESIEQLTGQGNLAFFDAISPIVTNDSLDHSICFRASRYDKGGDDYLNIPLNKEQYYQFVEDVSSAEKYTGNLEVESDSLDKLRPFEGCMPIEDMISRGPNTLLFGPLKPVGLRDPNTGHRPYAVLQLRQDDQQGHLWSMVGMQTRMKKAEQMRIFGSLPGLHNAEFVRLGTVHRNTFIDSPKCLEPTLEFRGIEGLFFAGQITGTEGYVESTAGGLIAGINAARLVRGLSTLTIPTETAIGSLLGYISDRERKDFQPMNISFGLMPGYLAMKTRDEKGRKISKQDRRETIAAAALSLTHRLAERLAESAETNLKTANSES